MRSFMGPEKVAPFLGNHRTRDFFYSPAMPPVLSTAVRSPVVLDKRLHWVGFFGMGFVEHTYQLTASYERPLLRLCTDLREPLAAPELFPKVARYAKVHNADGSLFALRCASSAFPEQTLAVLAQKGIRPCKSDR